MTVAYGIVTAEAIVVVRLVNAVAGLILVKTLEEAAIDKRYELKKTGYLLLADFE